MTHPRLPFLLAVPMRNLDSIFLIFEMTADCVCNEDGPMPAACAADGNSDVGFSFLLILRKKKVDESMHVLEELVRRIMGFHVFGDIRVGARERLQVRNKVGIRKKADIEDQVGIDGDAILETETYQ